MNIKVLIIEDDAKIIDFLKIGLEDAKFSVDSAADGATGWEKLNTNNYNIIILDVMLPGIDGLTLLSKMRSAGIFTPVLILSAKKTLEDRLAGLQLGGDDYLVKPFAFEELLARINVLLRRIATISTQVKLTYNDLEINLETRMVRRGNQTLNLQVKEFSLLIYFMQNPGKVLTKSLILEKIWGYDFDPQTNVVDVLVCRLRNKVDKDFTNKIIQTHRGVGYVLKQD